MTALARVARSLGLTRDAEPAPEAPLPGVVPPRRDGTALTAATALTLPAVYRAIQIHATSAAQLSLDVERGGSLLPVPTSLVRRPSLYMSRSSFLAATVVAMACHGEAFWHHARVDGAVASIDPLDPVQVSVSLDRDGRRVYHYQGRTLPRGEVSHIELMHVPGRLRGLGPIEAARVELAGMTRVRDYAAGWFETAAVPSGVVSTPQPLTSEALAQYKAEWNKSADGGVRVLGNGLSYAPIHIKPADAQWLETRRFAVTDVARMWGVPASLLLADVEGATRTYQNVEQDWISYVRFGLTAYLRPIEDALTELLPRGQEARFNYAALLRTDTKTRYEAHKIAIEAGFLTPQEARDIERLGPMPHTEPAREHA